MITFISLLTRNRLAIVGLFVISVVVILSLLTPFLNLSDPDITNTADRFVKPFSSEAILGTDHLGRDLLSRLFWGTRLSIAVGFAAALISAIVGAVIGIIAGFYGGNTDNILMRGVDMLMAFPYILLALAIVAALGPGLMNALIAVAVVNIPFFARNIRGVTVGIVHREFIDAARLSGMTDARIMITEVLPNVVPVIVIAMSTTVGWMILETAGLSFLGLGSQPPRADLGSMLGEARAALITNPHTSIIPGIMILIIVVAINLLGDGIRDTLDPRLKSGALTRPIPKTKVIASGQNKVERDRSLLQINGLNTEFQLKDRIYNAVRDVGLSIRKGECVGLIGESGSGKSVTALSITGLVASPPGVIAGGSVYFGEIDLVRAPYETLRKLRGNRISYIFQDPLATLHPLYTVGHQLVEAIRVHQSISLESAKSGALSLLKNVQIPNAEERLNAYPHELSGGMRQRVSIAMALVNDPELIIADEPTTALDVTVQSQILNLLDSLRRERGLAILFITHNFGVVSQLCDRVAVMYAGQIVEQGPTETILKSPSHPYTSRLMACVPKIGRGQGRLETIPGLPPSLDKIPRGCAFASRCAIAVEACRSTEIKMTATTNNTQVRCIAGSFEKQDIMQ